MSTPARTTKRQNQKAVKIRIKQILLSVKAQKQHIQNQLAKNDKKIKQYCQEYQILKQHDFTQLSQNQRQIFENICQGLQSQGIIPQKILGNNLEIRKFYQNKQKKQYKNITQEDIINIQEILITKLLSQIEKSKQ